MNTSDRNINSIYKGYIQLLIITLVLLLLDQTTKYYILKTIPLFDSIPVIPGFFNITHIHNTGGAFGVFADGHPLLRKILFIFISSAAIVVILFLYHKSLKSYSFLSIGLALIFSGAIGNMIDRVRFGKVVDFLDFYIGSLHWPAFNIADSAITIGMGIFVYYILLKKVDF